MPASSECGGEQAEAHFVGGAVAPDDVSRWEVAELRQLLTESGVVGAGDPHGVARVDVDGGGHRLEPLMVEVEFRNVEEGLGFRGVGRNATTVCSGGTSIGGLYVNLYARMFPQEMAGVVLLASNHPDDDVLERVMRFIPRSVARAGIGLSSGSSRRNAEERFLPQTATEIAQAAPFPDVPLTVVSSKSTAGLTTSPAQAATYVARQERLAAMSPRGRHITTFKASFIPQISDPALVVTTIRDIVNAGST
jgi:hypothetical protein